MTIRPLLGFLGIMAMPAFADQHGNWLVFFVEYPKICALQVSSAPENPQVFVELLITPKAQSLLVADRAPAHDLAGKYVTLVVDNDTFVGTFDTSVTSSQPPQPGDYYTLGALTPKDYSFINNFPTLESGKEFDVLIQNAPSMHKGVLHYVFSLAGFPQAKQDLLACLKQHF